MRELHREAQRLSLWGQKQPLLVLEAMGIQDVELGSMPGTGVSGFYPGIRGTPGEALPVASGDNTFRNRRAGTGVPGPQGVGRVGQLLGARAL